MKLGRDITTKIHFIFDNLLPPILRDSKFFMQVMLRLAYGKKYAKIFMNFKEKVQFMSEKEFSLTYSEMDNLIVRETDLNKGCINEILNDIKGKSVLEVGCGKAFLSNKIEKLGYNVTSADIYIDEKTKLKYPKIKFINNNIENLSFKDNEFDTVVCTHTLEHVRNLTKAISELKRVAKKRFIIVVPKQRPYKYTFDLHLHFFPYPHSFLQLMNPSKNKYLCKIIDRDIYYFEDLFL